MSLDLAQRTLSEVGFGPSAASVEHVNGPTLPVISRSYVDTEFHGSLNSPAVNFADSNESLLGNFGTWLNDNGVRQVSTRCNECKAADIASKRRRPQRKP